MKIEEMTGSGVAVLSPSLADMIRGRRQAGPIRLDQLPPSPDVEITPDDARLLLASSNGNRAITRQRVSTYADAMAQGKWMLNGETIIIGTSGALLNGHHRCHACIVADTPFVTKVVKGIPDENFVSIDQGKERGAGQVLAMTGTKQSAAVAASLRVILAVKRGYPRIGVPFTNIEIVEASEEYPGIVDYIRLCYETHRFAPMSIIAGLCYLFGEADSAKAAEFGTRLTTGEGLQAGSPILLLRQKLLADKMSSRRMLREDIASLTVVAWNAFAAGRPVKRLSLPAEWSGLPKIYGR